MDDSESPLEVLSRAATMMEPINSTDDSKQSITKELPTAKWKRDRKPRADYMRKSDPKLPEDFKPEINHGGSYNEEANGFNDAESSADSERPNPVRLYEDRSNGERSYEDKSNRNSEKPNSNPRGDTPLDMTIKHRGSPPSYMQTITNPSFKSNYRPSVITPNSVPEDIPSGISMCDPIIDEHFRRSLGKDYVAIFSNNNVNKDPPTPPRVPSPPSNVNKLVVELMDDTGMSVDDHFAKALGDTWMKLNKKEKEPSGVESQSVLSI